MKLHRHRAVEPPLSFQLLHDKSDAIATTTHWENPDILRTGYETAHDGFARRIEQNEIVMVRMHGDTAGGGPLLRALRLVPLAGVTTDVVKTLRCHHPQ